MSKILGFLASVFAVVYCVGCSTPSDVSDSDQKANEKKYSQAGYEQAMHAAGRDKELQEQKKLEAERGRG